MTLSYDPFNYISDFWVCFHVFFIAMFDFNFSDVSGPVTGASGIMDGLALWERHQGINQNLGRCLCVVFLDHVGSPQIGWLMLVDVWKIMKRSPEPCGMEDLIRSHKISPFWGIPRPFCGVPSEKSVCERQSTDLEMRLDLIPLSQEMKQTTSPHKIHDRIN